jgi:hypothetical protein
VARCEVGRFGEEGLRRKNGELWVTVTVQKEREQLKVRSAKGLASELEEDEDACQAVREEIERFLEDGSKFLVTLSSGVNAQQRSFAHALAEHHGLAHSTRWDARGAASVRLSKEKRACRLPFPRVPNQAPASETLLLRAVTDAVPVAALCCVAGRDGPLSGA